MSAEYSVEEVREQRDRLRSGRYSNVDLLHIQRMLTAYAKRIKADEGAVPARGDLDVIRQAIEERDAAMQACDDLAQHMVYKGNSVGWWHSKATAYRAGLDECWKALGELGIRADGKTHVADVIRTLTAPNHPHSPDAADSGRVGHQPIRHPGRGPEDPPGRVAKANRDRQRDAPGGQRGAASP